VPSPAWSSRLRRLGFLAWRSRNWLRRVKRCTLPAARAEVVQIFQQLDGLVVVRGALHLDERVDSLPQLRLASGEAIEVPGSCGRLFTLTACPLFRCTLRRCAAPRLGVVLGGREELLNGSAAGHVVACPITRGCFRAPTSLQELRAEMGIALRHEAQKQVVLLGIGQATDPLGELVP
jgi:hypothetical protein